MSALRELLDVVINAQTLIAKMPDTSVLVTVAILCNQTATLAQVE